MIKGDIKNMEKGSIKYLIIMIILISLFGMILYPLFDLILCKFITNSKFIYSVYDHIIEPIYFGIILGIVFWITDKKRSK